MATDTPNFNWPIPEDTDLVKDGAKAIRDLGNAIDTSAQDFGGGLVHINTTTFSAVASQSVNNVFSATYKNYKVMIHIETASTGSTASIRMRSSGTDYSTSTYQRATIFNHSLAVGPFATAQSNANNWTETINYDSAKTASVILDLFYPFESTFTRGNLQGTNNQSGQFYNYLTSLYINATNSFDGFTVTASSGNITGSISIFGYKD
jgi:hypothetical protein